MWKQVAFQAEFLPVCSLVRRLIICLSLAAVATLSVTQDASPQDSEKSRKFYELSVAAYEKGNLLRTQQYLRKALQLAPGNAQALKLKEVVDEFLRPAGGKSGGEVAPWALYDGDNVVDFRPQFVHIAHTSDGSTSDLAYMMIPLRFPKEAVRCDVEFKIKSLGDGSVPTGVALRTAENVLMSIEAGKDLVALGGNQTVWRRKNDTKWHEYRIDYHAGSAQIFMDGRLVTAAPCASMPEMLVFGSPEGASGRQTEAWFEWLGSGYNIPKS